MAVTIATQPIAGNIQESQTILFTLSASTDQASTGDPQMTHSWFHIVGGPNTIGVTQSLAETSSRLSLLITQTSASAAGTYFCYVDDPEGGAGATSSKVNLTVKPLLKTNPVAAVTLNEWSSYRYYASGSTTGSAGAATSATYQWYKGVYALSSSAVAIPQGTSSVLYISPVTASWTGISQSIFCKITSASGSVYTSASVITLQPNVTTQPTTPPEAITQWRTATLTVAGSGSGVGVTYQWYKGSSALSGQTAATLTLPRIQPSDTGNYYCLIGGVSGSSTSSTVTVTTVPMGAPGASPGLPNQSNQPLVNEHFIAQEIEDELLGKKWNPYKRK